MEWTLYTAPNNHEWKLSTYRRDDPRDPYPGIHLYATHLDSGERIVEVLDLDTPTNTVDAAIYDLRRAIDEHPLGRKES